MCLSSIEIEQIFGFHPLDPLFVYGSDSFSESSRPYNHQMYRDLSFFFLSQTIKGKSREEELRELMERDFQTFREKGFKILD